MIKKLVYIFVALIFAFNIAYSEEEEISLLDMLENDAVPVNSEDVDNFLEKPDGEQQTFSNNENTDETLPDGSKIITVTAGGDVTIGGDVRKKKKSAFDIELDKQGGDLSFPFRNVKHIFENDDMTLLNFEGTLTTAAPNRDRKSHRFIFSAPPSYVDMLKLSSVEAVALENNHVMDHGKDGYEETMQTLDNAGIVYSNAHKLGVYKAKGVEIAMLSYQTFNGMYPYLFEQVPKDVQAAKAKYPIVIVSFHWGEEKDYWPNANQQKLGKLTIDSGADLVLGHHSHRSNPIEEYKGKYIVYGLGNCSFAGNNKPSDMSTFLFQIRFKVLDNKASTDSFRIIPCRISSRTDYNDFAITPYDKEFNIDSLINTLIKNGKHLENPVTKYPLEF